MDTMKDQPETISRVKDRAVDKALQLMAEERQQRPFFVSQSDYDRALIDVSEESSIQPFETSGKSIREETDAVMNSEDALKDVCDPIDQVIISQKINGDKQKQRAQLLRAMLAKQSQNVTPVSKKRKARRVESLEPRLAMAGLDTADWGELPAGTPAGVIEQIQAHPGAMVYDLALSPDGTRIATAGQDKILKILDAETGQNLHSIYGHNGSIYNVAYSPDGITVASASADRTVKLWNSSTGVLIRQINLPSNGSGVEFSSDGKFLAVGVGDGLPTQLHNLQTGEVSQVSYHPSSEAIRFTFSEDGKTLYHSDRNNVLVYDTVTKSVTRTLTGLGHHVYSIDVDPTNTFIAAGDNGGKTAIWRVDTGERKALLADHVGQPASPGGVWSLQFSADSRHLVSGDFTGNVIVRSLQPMASGGAPVVVQTYAFPSTTVSFLSSPRSQNMIYSMGHDPQSTRMGMIPLPDPPSLPSDPPPEENPPEEMSAELAEDAEELRLDARAALQQKIDEFTAACETEEVVPGLHIAAWANDTTKLVLHTISMPEGMSLKLGDVKVAIPPYQDTTVEFPLAQVSTSPDRIMFTASIVKTDTGETVVPDLGSFGIANGRHTYTTERGYGDVTRSLNPAIESITYTRISSASYELQTKLGLLTALLNDLNAAQGQNILQAATRGLVAANAVTLASPVESSASLTSELQQQISMQLNGEMQESAETGTAASMSILDIQGPNILIALASPHNKSTLRFETTGLLASDTLIHENGTNFAIGRLTFDAAQPTGDYPLNMYGPDSTQILDTIILHWDQPSRTLSLVSAPDMFIALSEKTETLAMQNAIATFNSILRLKTSNLDDTELNLMQQKSMYWGTGHLQAPYNIYIGRDALEEAIFTVHPEYRPENWEAGIQALAEQRPTFSYSSTKRRFHITRKDYIERMRENLKSHEKSMLSLMQKASEIILKIRQGEAVDHLLQALEAERANWLNKLGPNQYRPYARDIHELQTLGITLPSVATILEAAEQMIDLNWGQMLQMEKDVIAKHRYEDQLRDSGLRQTADGSWVAISPYDRSNTPQEMDRRQITLANKIAAAMQSSPRLMALHENARQQTALMIASVINVNTTISEDDQILAMLDSDIALGTMTDEDALMATVGMIAARNKVAAMDPGAVYAEATQWYNKPAGMTTFAEIQGVVIRDDTAAGRIFMGIYQDAFSYEGEEMKVFLAKAASVLGLKAEVLWYIGRNKNYQAFFQELVSQFDERGFGHIFINSQQQPTTLNEMLNVQTDATYYTNSSERIRVYFDFSGNDPSYHQANVYLIKADGTQVPTALLNNFTGKLFAEIPLESIAPNMSVSSTFKLKVAVWKTSAPNLPGLQGEYFSDPFQVQYSGGQSIADNPFHNLNNQLDDKLEGISWGVDWDDRSITDSCVFTARAIVEHFGSLYGNAAIPVIGGDGYAGAARLMSNVEVKGQIFEEREVPGFNKYYLSELPEYALPPIGAILVWNANVGGGYGHVAIVTGINSDGTVNVIDGNWNKEEIIVNGEPYSVGVGSIHTASMNNVIGWMLPITY